MYKFKDINKRKIVILSLLAATLAAILVLDSCRKVQADSKAGLPPDAVVVPVADGNLFSVEHPEQFPTCPAASTLR